MQVPSFLSPFVDGDSPKRLFQGLATGVIATLVIGFGWGGWELGGTVDQKVETATQTAMVKALAPICADRFAKAATTDKALAVSLGAVRSWERDAHLMKAGWATFAGAKEPDTFVAEACATMLSESLKLK